MDRRRIVIVGGVAAGPKAAARARRVDEEAEITLVEKGSLVSYASCGLPLYLAGMVSALDSLRSTPSGLVRDEGFFWREKRVRVLTHTVTTAIDRQAHLVHARNKDGELTLPYDRLVLATGSQPLVPPITGLEEGRGSWPEGVFGLHTPPEADALRRVLARGKRATVVGGGLIGLEVADALAARRLQVTVVEARNTLLPGVLDPDLARLLAQHLAQQGWQLLTGAPVQAITRANGQLQVEAAGHRQEADLVVVACGVRPEVTLAGEAGLKIGPTGAIATDDFLATSDPHIYAAGDCAETVHRVTGRKVWIPLASTANKQGRVAGTNAAGGGERFPGVAGTAVLQVGDWNVARTGLGEEEARAFGYEVVTSFVAGTDGAHYHPLHAPVAVKIIAEAREHRLLGAQALGPGEAVKRVDVLATAISFAARLEDVAQLDLGYAPPFATAIDICLHAANQARNKLEERAEGITASELKARMDEDRGRAPVIVDVRTPEEYGERRLPYPTLHLPLGELRERLGEIPAGEEIV
ncbi:MAG TPA: FAD-dependent oxidoreductase, partial [Firmicutes bacterium]|nr:FAD-dependent oxidoreductase [Bacillota bacterium]